MLSVELQQRCQALHSSRRGLHGSTCRLLKASRKGLRAGTSSASLRCSAAAGNGTAPPPGPMKRMPRWDLMWEKLYSNPKLQILSAEEASKLSSDRWQIVDVRPKHRFEESHAEGSVNVELYRRTDFSKFNFVSWLRAAALMSNGVDPVELNENFLAELQNAAGSKGVVLMCEVGGTLTPTVSFATGKVSRSLMATYNALESGLFPGGIAHVKGGCFAWYKAELSMTGEYDASGVGRTPSVVEVGLTQLQEETFSYGRKTEGLKIDP